MQITASIANPSEASSMVGGKLKNGAKIGLADFAPKILRTMQAICPHDTGALERSHYTELVDEGDGTITLFFGFKETPETIANFIRQSRHSKERTNFSDTFYGAKLHSGEWRKSPGRHSRPAVMVGWVNVAYNTLHANLIQKILNGINQVGGTTANSTII